jgi:hypothetical protein
VLISVKSRISIRDCSQEGQIGIIACVEARDVSRICVMLPTKQMLCIGMRANLLLGKSDLTLMKVKLS